MLIVEGADLVGKTTLCHKLIKILNERFGYSHIYSHLSKPPRGWDYVGDYISNARRNTVQDRFHMSEPLYATIRQEEAGIHEEQYRLVDGYLRAQGAFTVVIHASSNLIADRFNDRADQEMYNIQQVLQVNELFHKVCDDGQIYGYKMDIDMPLWCDSDEPWITDQTIETIIEKYVARYDFIERYLE